MRAPEVVIHSGNLLAMVTKNDFKNANYLAKELRILYTISSEGNLTGSNPDAERPAGATHRSPLRPEVNKGRSDGGKERLTHETQVY